jgi:hypothetical protein
MNLPQSIDRIASPEANWGQIEGYQDIKKRGASQAVAKLDFVTHHPLPMTGLGGKLIRRIEMPDSTFPHTTKNRFPLPGVINWTRSVCHPTRNRWTLCWR